MRAQTQTLERGLGSRCDTRLDRVEDKTEPMVFYLVDGTRNRTLAKRTQRPGLGQEPATSPSAPLPPGTQQRQPAHTLATGSQVSLAARNFPGPTASVTPQPNPGLQRELSPPPPASESPPKSQHRWRPELCAHSLLAPWGRLRLEAPLPCMTRSPHTRARRT